MKLVGRKTPSKLTYKLAVGVKCCRACTRAEKCMVENAMLCDQVRCKLTRGELCEPCIEEKRFQPRGSLISMREFEKMVRTQEESEWGKEGA